MHPLIKVPAAVGTALTVALLIASAFTQSSVPALVSIGTAALTVLQGIGQAVTVKQAAKKPATAPVAATPPAPPAKPAA